MTAAEITAKQQSVQDSWTGYASWNFNEQTCAYEAPTPMPTDDKIYRWDEPTTSWVAV